MAPNFFLALLLCANLCFAQQPTEQRIDSLQTQIDQLKEELRATRARPSEDLPGTGEKRTEGKTSLGGYGEFNINNYRDGRVKDVADLRRFVVFLGHSFNEQLQLYSELEVEHAKVEGGSSGGEVALEQAYLQYSLNDVTKVRAGLMLMPGGFLNEYHEPPVYYGVERNEIETRIIPSTWRELGVSLQGQLSNGIEYNAGVATSLDASKFTDASSGVRDMRSEGTEAAAHDLALFAGLNYRAIPGLTVGGSIYAGNTAQGGRGSNPNSSLEGISARLTLWDLHARYSANGFDLRALYARGRLSDTAQINTAAGIAPNSGAAAPESFLAGISRVPIACGAPAISLWPLLFVTSITTRKLQWRVATTPTSTTTNESPPWDLASIFIRK